jgi:hypothetical protein
MRTESEWTDGTAGVDGTAMVAVMAALVTTETG